METEHETHCGSGAFTPPAGLWEPELKGEEMTLSTI